MTAETSMATVQVGAPGTGNAKPQRYNGGSRSVRELRPKETNRLPPKKAAPQPARTAPLTTGKYVISKADGSPVDPGARYLVLRLDTDPFARKAAEAYAEVVAEANPRLAEAVRDACAATPAPGWSLPKAPTCACGSPCRPIALEDFGRWSLEWECYECCDPVEGPAIPWPFVERFAEGSDFERIGLAWDYA
jgi:hypothetical protein